MTSNMFHTSTVHLICKPIHEKNHIERSWQNHAIGSIEIPDLLPKFCEKDNCCARSYSSSIPAANIQIKERN